MAARIALGLIILGSLLVGIFISRAQNQKGQPPEPDRLIESIQGPALYKAYCAGCHGADGKAGPMAKSLKVPPADLTRIARRNGGKFPLARVEKIISGEDSGWTWRARHAGLGAGLFAICLGPGPRKSSCVEPRQVYRGNAGKVKSKMPFPVCSHSRRASVAPRISPTESAPRRF